MESANTVNLVFMGSDEIALPALDFLSRQPRVCIQAVYTQPDRARGRGKKVVRNAIKLWADEREIPVYQPESFNGEAMDELDELKPDLILVMAYGHILKDRVLALPPLGIFNLHASLLPKLRGASPIETAIATGEKVTGVTLMGLVSAMDAGPMFDKAEIVVEGTDTGGSMRVKLAEACPELLERNLEGLLGGTLSGVEQALDEVTYCRLLVKQDGGLNFEASAEELCDRIQGLNPWPGCFARFGDSVIKVGAAGFEPGSISKAGQLVSADDSGVLVETGSGLLRLLKLQKPGGKMLSAGDFLRGFPMVAGDHFSSSPMHGLVSMKPVSHKRVFQLYK